MKYILPLMALVMLSGCTQRQIDEAKAMQAQAHQILTVTEEAHRATQAALAEMKAIAAKIGGASGEALVAKAEHMLEVTGEKVADARDYAKKMDGAVEVAVASHDAGGTTVDVLLGLLTYFVPGAAALVAIRKAMNSGRALKQTVQGLDNVRKIVGDTQWDASIAPSLEDAQDADVKVAVKKIQAAA